MFYLETQAKLHIQSLVRIGAIKLTWSYMLDYENGKNPYEENKMAIFTWRNIAASFVKHSNEQIVNFAQQMQFQYGVKKFDALHVSCAVYDECDYFITTDAKLLKTNVAEIRIINPIDFVILLGDIK